MAFSTRITDEENEKAVDRYRQALITDLDYIQTCLQTMSFDDDHQDVEGECPPKLTYARSQISELDYGLFWPAVREMSSYLASVVDLGKADNMYEIQVLVEAGLWLAELIAGQDSTELYQKFNVCGCSEVDYRSYIATFKSTYQKVNSQWEVHIMGN